MTANLADATRTRDVAFGAGAICEKILDSLPRWFGIPDAVRGYVETCETTASIVASRGVEDVGILNLREHNRYSAEVWLLAVLPELHRQGIGRALVAHAERTLAHRGVQFLQVKTLSAARKDPGYEKTRAFYVALGFVPLEEFPTLWDEASPALQMITTVEQSRH